MTPRLHTRLPAMAPATLAISLLGCAPDQTLPATEVVVVVESDLTVGTQLTEIRASVQSDDGTRTVAAPFPFALQTPARGGGGFGLPLSFGVGRPRDGADLFRLTVSGYGPLGPDGTLVKVVEHKALIGFQAQRTLRASVRLRSACLQTLCDESADLTCAATSPDPAAKGMCSAIAAAPVTLVAPSEAKRIDILPTTPETSQGSDPSASKPDAGDGGGPAPVFDDRARILGAGAHHVCVVRPDATVACWGSNYYGQLGLGATPDRAVAPTVVPGLSEVAEIAVGGFHTCARKRSGEVLCWGSNRNGAVGGATADERVYTPVAVTGVLDAVELATGDSHSCVRRRDATVTCWGDNFFGQLGDGTSIQSKVPVNAPGLTGVLRLAKTFEGRETCAFKAKRALVCVKESYLGQVKVNAVDELGPVNGYAGGLVHSCVLNEWGDVYCRGGNDRGQTGPGNPLSDAYLQLKGVSYVKLLAAGTYHTCGVREDGTVVCWGANESGQLGDGATAATSPPVAVRALTDVVDIVAGEAFTCARRADHTLSCWGASMQGVLGNAPSSLTPVLIPGA